MATIGDVPDATWDIALCVVISLQCGNRGLSPLVSSFLRRFFL